MPVTFLSKTESDSGEVVRVSGGEAGGEGEGEGERSRRERQATLITLRPWPTYMVRDQR